MFFLNGQADEVAVYGRALSQPEIAGIVRQGSSGKCAPAECVAAPAGLISSFEAEGNALDSSSTNHGTNTGVAYTVGKVGSAFFFDASSDRIATNSSFSQSYQQLSVEAWVNPTSHGVGGVAQYGRKVVSNAHAGGFSLEVHDGFLQAVYRLSDDSYTIVKATTAQLPLNQWSHVAMTYNGSVIKGYVSGLEVFSQNATGAIRNIGNLNSCLMIGNDPDEGCNPDAGDYSWRGGIDEPAIYNRGLTQAEIQSIVAAGDRGKCSIGTVSAPANQISWFTGDGNTSNFVGGPAGALKGDAKYAARESRAGLQFRRYRGLCGSARPRYPEVSEPTNHRGLVPALHPQRRPPAPCLQAAAEF
jgi:hypothetical protein